MTMTSIAHLPCPATRRAGDGRSATEIARELGPTLAANAARRTDEDRFVADSFAALKEAGLLTAAAPRELGGGGADLADLSGMLRQVAYHCPSTGLAFAMHTHQVAIPAWRWQHQPAARAAVEPLLRRVVQERLVLLSSGGSDWISGSGKAERVEGGYRITARKVFTSGAPAGDLLMTSAVLEEPGQPATVLHFGIPMSSSHVRVLDTWHTLGMRGTGSHDVSIDGHVVPEASVSVKRPAGEWHLLFQIIATVAFPLIYSVYVGVAESARDIAIGLAKRRPAGPHTVALAGRLDTELTAARLALDFMLAVAARHEPSAANVNDAMKGRHLAGRHAIAAVEAALELAGGAGFYRAAGLEGRFRDIQAARYHPLQTGPQREYTGAMALGLPVDRVW